MSPGQIAAAALPLGVTADESAVPLVYSEEIVRNTNTVTTEVRTDPDAGDQVRKDSASDPFSDRKPITELLHDIYDKNPR